MLIVDNQKQYKIMIRKTNKQEKVMRYINRWLIAVLVIAALQITACQKHSEMHEAEHPAEIVKVEGTDLSKVILTEKAIERLALKTDKVRESKASGTVVPYSSLIYDINGQAWVYTSPEPRTFVRAKVDVDRVDGNTAILNDGPPVGTVVASVAVAELYGAEFKVGH
jgi:outer membrane receptor for ferric coprogen and ferric-rhodotorulic acid